MLFIDIIELDSQWLTHEPLKKAVLPTTSMKISNFQIHFSEKTKEIRKMFYITNSIMQKQLWKIAH